MSKKYNMVILTQDEKMYYNRWVYNGLSLDNIYYVYDYKVVCLYVPFKLELFYLDIYKDHFKLTPIINE